jgi:DNA-binding Lrp family transcriptional regulator
MSKQLKNKLNDDEKKVLTYLRYNSNQSIEQIAKNCSVTTQKLIRIKKKLERNKIIWGYVALTDYGNIDLNHFTCLFKRTTNPLKKEVIEDVTKGFMEDYFPDGTIRIENILYVHGDYDWIISFTAPDTLTMKKFCDKLIKIYGEFIENYTVHQTIIPIRKHGIKNPIADKQGGYLGG